MSKATSEVFERWNFSIETDSEVVEKGYFPSADPHQTQYYNIMLTFLNLLCFLGLNLRVSREKSDKEIMREIQAIMRQIASSITYLPCLDEPC